MDLEQKKLLEKFQKSLVTFFDELVEMFPNEKDFILIRILVKDQIPSTQIMSYFEMVMLNKEITSSIERRDDDFILSNVLFYKVFIFIGTIELNFYKVLHHPVCRNSLIKTVVRSYRP